MAVLAGLALLAALIGLVVVALRYKAEACEVKRVRSLFSRYVSPPIVDELLRRKDPHLYTGRSLQATILVCRIWNFAGFAEALSAQETLRYLNEFFALAGTSIQKHRGMIDKFLGDGIIGVFGVPLEDPLAEENALRAALSIIRLVDAMDRRWRAQGRRSFQVGIGINSGEVIAGDAGFNERREFTVVGPQTLFAALLQEATFELNVYVVAAATTCNAVRDRFSLVPLTGHPLPGLKRLADAFIVLGLTHEIDTLTMPGPAAFKTTKVIDPPAPPPPVPRVELMEPIAPLVPRKRPAQTALDTTFGFPELGAAHSPYNLNDRAIYPDPPVPPRNAAYEDDDGPPFSLPP